MKTLLSLVRSSAKEIYTLESVSQICLSVIDVTLPPDTFISSSFLLNLDQCILTTHEILSSRPIAQVELTQFQMLHDCPSLPISTSHAQVYSPAMYCYITASLTQLHPYKFSYTVPRLPPLSLAQLALKAVTIRETPNFKFCTHFFLLLFVSNLHLSCK